MRLAGSGALGLLETEEYVRSRSPKLIGVASVWGGLWLILSVSDSGVGCVPRGILIVIRDWPFARQAVRLILMWLLMACG